MKMILIFALTLALALPLSVNAFAQTEPVSPLTNLGAYQARSLHLEEDTTMFNSPYLETMNTGADIDEDSPANKMGIGVMNAATSWTDLPREVARVSEEDNALAGWTWGFGQGLVYGIARGVSGAIEVATFGVPPYDDPLVKPEYKVQQPDEGFKVDLMRW